MDGTLFIACLIFRIKFYLGLSVLVYTTLHISVPSRRIEKINSCSDHWQDTHLAHSLNALLLVAKKLSWRKETCV